MHRIATQQNFILKNRSKNLIIWFAFLIFDLKVKLEAQ